MITVYWKIIRGLRCKLNCTYCKKLIGLFNKEEKNKIKSKPIINLINQLSNHHIIEVVYYGGDNNNKLKLPYLYHKLLNQNVKQTIYTTFFTQPEYFLKWNFNCNMNLILAYHHEYHTPEEFKHNIDAVNKKYNIEKIIVPVSAKFNHIGKISQLLSNYNLSYRPILFVEDDIANVEELKKYSLKDYMYWKKEITSEKKICKIQGLYIYNNKVYMCLNKKGHHPDNYIGNDMIEDINNIIYKNVLCDLKYCNTDFYKKVYL